MTDSGLTISPGDLVDMAEFTRMHPLRVDVVYAQADHRDNMFGRAIYRADARMWAHRLLAPIIVSAANICFRQSGCLFELKDCLRPVEAQARMVETDIVRENPQWIEEPNRLLSPPGRGGHPRGMAIDIVLIDENGDEVDMGTRFDHLVKNHRVNNPSARGCRDFPQEVLQNRQLLEDCMKQAAQEAGMDILPLPQEWWDFRFLPDFSNQYRPISDADLPPHMRVVLD